MKIHFLGICGTFMGSIALLAKELGHTVVGSDHNVYPPMSTQLAEQGITLYQDYLVEDLADDTDLLVIGNNLKRNNPLIEYILNHKLNYISGPQWLYENVLRQRKVIAIAGTHGKTTTSSMLAWILEVAELNPGYLIGGVPSNLGISATLGTGDCFVIEADEYDTAFFDKRSKFIHYRPDLAILNNLEFDHADIFRDLDDVKRQFAHLIRTIPSDGDILVNAQDKNLAAVIEEGCWSRLNTFLSQDAHITSEDVNLDASKFSLCDQSGNSEAVSWGLIGQHNIANALAAANAAHLLGVDLAVIATALSSFKNTKRRLELKAQIDGITVYDDFAHHPTAVATTLAGLRAHVREGRIIAVIEFGSYTMRHGCHEQMNIVNSLKQADRIFASTTQDKDWDAAKVFREAGRDITFHQDPLALAESVVAEAQAGDTIVILCNTSFRGFYQNLLAKLDNTQEISHELN